MSRVDAQAVAVVVCGPSQPLRLLQKLAFYETDSQQAMVVAGDNTTPEADNPTAVVEAVVTTTSRVEVAVEVAGREWDLRSLLGLRLRISYWNNKSADTSINGLDGWQRKGDDARRDIAIPDWNRPVKYTGVYA